MTHSSYDIKISSFRRDIDSRRNYNKSILIIIIHVLYFSGVELIILILSALNSGIITKPCPLVHKIPHAFICKININNLKLTFIFPFKDSSYKLASPVTIFIPLDSTENKALFRSFLIFSTYKYYADGNLIIFLCVYV